MPAALWHWERQVLDNDIFASFLAIIITNEEVLIIRWILNEPVFFLDDLLFPLATEISVVVLTDAVAGHELVIALSLHITIILFLTGLEPFWFPRFGW